MGGDATAALLATLDAVGATGRTVALWWRDDDLERPSVRLDALLGAVAEHGIVPALAAVAGRMLPETLGALQASPAPLFVHGWRHADHAAAGAKKAEYGPERPLEVRLAEIAEGRRRLSALAGDRLVACFVPPWNRLGADLLGRLRETGMTALSGFAPWAGAPAPADVPRLDTHVDLIDWRNGRTALTAAAVAAALETRIRAAARPGCRESSMDGPIGILSHHLVTDPAAWRAWQPLWAATAGHPAVRWLDPRSALAAVAPVASVDAGNDVRRIG